jgi:hypothetical protein
MNIYGLQSLEYAAAFDLFKRKVISKLLSFSPHVNVKFDIILQYQEPGHVQWVTNSKGDICNLTNLDIIFYT